MCNQSHADVIIFNPLSPSHDKETAAGGKPTGTDYHPYEVDTTLENGDTWFYQETAGYKSFAELISIYHASVGHGGNLLLNIAPPTNTTIPTTAMALYKQLGDFVEECYGDGTFASKTALNSTTHRANVSTVTLMIGKSSQTNKQSRSTSSFTSVSEGEGREIVAAAGGGGGGSPPEAYFDRVQLKEDLTNGQLVTSFQILADSNVVFNGTSVGANMIAQLNRNITATNVTLKVTSALAMPSFDLVAIPSPASCYVRSDG